MPRLPAPVATFLSSLCGSLEKAHQVDFGSKELASRFESAVASLPDCQLKQDIIRHSNACLYQLKRDLDGKFSSVSVPQTLVWNLAAADGVESALAGLAPSDLLQYGALLCSSYGQRCAQLVLTDFLVKAAPGSDGNGAVMASALASFARLCVLCPAYDSLSALWRFLNEQISTVSSIATQTLAPVASALERALRVVHLRRISPPLSSSKIQPGMPMFADLMAACLSWLTDVHISIHNSSSQGQEISEIMSTAAQLLGDEALHLLDMVLQVSIAPVSQAAFDLLLPLIRGSCEHCTSLDTAATCVKFLACCRIGRKLAQSSPYPAHTSLAAEFRRIGLAVSPPPELRDWLHKNCDGPLLESLSVDRRWSSHQLCMHLLLYADEDAVDNLLDVASGVDDSTAGASAVDTANVLGAGAMAVSDRSADAAAGGLFIVDVAGTGDAMQSDSDLEPGDTTT